MLASLFTLVLCSAHLCSLVKVHVAVERDLPRQRKGSRNRVLTLAVDELDAELAGRRDMTRRG